GDGMLFTGRLSTTTHPWLADHTIAGTVLLPGTAFVELAVHVGYQVGCGRLDELTLRAPFALPEGEAARLQAWVGGADEAGHRPIAVYSRPEDHTAADEVWTCHATGRLVPETTAAPAPEAAWPPPGAVAVPLDGLYEDLEARGYDYGPLFQGLTAVWRRGEDLFAEASWPGGAEEAEEFALHPALLDAALHALGTADETRSLRLPFAWSGVALHATGATELRIRLTPTGTDEVALLATDTAGAPVVSVDALTLRAVSPQQLAAPALPADRLLYAVEWQSVASDSVEGGSWAVLGVDAYGDLASLAASDEVPGTVFAAIPSALLDGGAPAASAHAVTRWAVELCRTWLAEERFAGSRLVLVTRNAVPVHEHEPVDPA
ncbi:polyketide synthase dehydratase domain-containing protein, partial [Kitasatospora sp. NPDC001159]